MAKNLPTTEGVRVGDPALSEMSTEALVEAMVSDLDAVRDSLAAATPALVGAIDRIAERMSAGGRLIYVGAGTSGRLAQLDAAECPPTFGISPDRVQALLAGGSEASKLAVEAAEDDEDDALAQLAAIAPEDADTVLGISASGSTPFVIAALREARRRGALTVGVSCNRAAPLSDEVDLPIELVVGEELLSGSTRLKCGTAQKVLLNTVSTIAMVRLGKTYGRLMVDVKPTNAKLVERALRIVESVTGADRAAAERAFEETGRDTKASIVAISRGVSAAQAQRLLAAAGGRLDAVLA